MTRPKAWAFAAALLAVAACGLEPKTSVDSARLESLKALAQKANRLSDLQQQAYTRNTLLRFSSAEADYRETLGLARDLFPTDPARASTLRLNLALNKSNLGQYEAAEDLFKQSRDIVRTQGAVGDRAKADLFYAQHLMNLKQWSKAETLALDTAEGLRQRIDKMAAGDANAGVEAVLTKRPDGTVEIDQARANIANAQVGAGVLATPDGVRIGERDRLKLQRVHARYIAARAKQAQSGKSAEVLPLLDLAEKDLGAVPDVYGRWLRAEIGSLKADQFVLNGDPKSALRELDQAILILRRFEVNTRPEALLLFKKGEILIQSGEGGPGQQAFREALKIFKEDDQGLDPAQAQTVIDQLLQDAQAGNEEAKAELFTVMQKVRSSATAQTLAQLSARLASGDGATADAIRNVQNLEREQNILSARLDRLEADPQADLHFKRVTEGRLGDTQAGLAKAREELARIAPNYDQLVDAIIPLADAQAALGDGEVMAIIQLGADKGLVAVLTRLSFDAYEIPMNVVLAEEQVRALRAPIDGEFLLKFDVGAANELFKTLFGPVATRVREAKHLIVVPSGPLLSLPFNTLPVEPVEGEIAIAGADTDAPYFDYSKVKFLGSVTGITTAVSISSFFLGRKTAPSAASQAFRGFGDFAAFGNAPDVIAKVVQDRGLPTSCSPSIAALGQLNQLSGTRTEMEKIAAILGTPSSDIVLGQDFNDTAVKASNLRDYKVLHFATHGLLAQSPECLPEPGLVTSLGTGGDSLLEASEIVDLNLDADLVVMSACDTSAGAGVGAEGLTGFRGVGGSYAAGGESLTGLARSFFYAGARNVLSTQWSVDDTATQELMVAFYSAGVGAETVSIAEAMRLAQVKQIEGGQLSHPFYWAPFAVIGDGARQLRLAPPPAADAAPAAPGAPATAPGTPAVAPGTPAVAPATPTAATGTGQPASST